MNDITGVVSEIESKVIKKTNKYVYFNDGTHLSYSDFHKLKQDIRKEYAVLHNKEFENSVLKALALKVEVEKLEQITYELENQQSVLEYFIHECSSENTTDFEKYFRDEVEKHNKTKDQMRSIGRTIYKNLNLLPLSDYQETNGKKFIIQKNYQSDEYRFCFDPYGFCGNFHSDISDIFRDDNFGTINGGWYRLIGDTLTLYSESGDYGVYDDQIALELAQKLFPDKTVISYPGLNLE